MTITVKDTIKETAQALGVGKEVESYLQGNENGTGEQATKLLLDCFQRVENELALDYLPLLAEEEALAYEGRVYYRGLNFPVARIIRVENEWGENVRFKLFPDRIETSSGKVKVIYAYAPSTKTVDSNSEYTTDVSQRLLVYGMAAEYSLAIGELTAARIWDKKYKEGVQAAYKVGSSKRIRSRRWA